MKFKVDRQEFHKAIATVDSIIPAREIRSIISNILIEAEPDRITLTATDLEMGIKTSLPVQTERKGQLTLPAKKLSQAIREFRGAEISFQSDADNRITIQDATGVSKARITLMGSASNDYPQIPTLPDNRYNAFPVSMAVEMIRKCAYAMAEEDARYVFNGLFVTSDGPRVAFVATDGRRLSRVVREFPQALPFKEGVILPNKAVREMLKLLDSSEEGRIAFDEKDRRVYLRIGGVDLITKLIDGQFPDYEQVVPKKLAHRISLDRAAFENSLRQVAVMAAEPSRQVRLSFGGGALNIAASTPDIGEGQDTLPADYSAEEITIAFNSNYLLDVLKTIGGGAIRAGFSTSSAPAVIEDPDDKDFVAVIMPMKI
ncbi:MAG: DNA polymerase III subunit beta [Leptospirales bacterium]|nr:DNA polymerase III subunit beta [Leptospirales bacterium]